MKKQDLLKYFDDNLLDKLLQNIISVPNFEIFKDKISALQNRYEEYISQTRGEANEN